MVNIVAVFEEKETILMDKILDSAKRFGFSAYTSARVEDWRMSIRGLTASLKKAQEMESPLMFDNRLVGDNALTTFGVEEAKLHRTRGVTLEMFLSLMKYYRDAYLEVIAESASVETPDCTNASWVMHAFDQIEMAFIREWTSHSSDEKLKEMQVMTMKLTNEKNRYLALFESLPVPILLLDENNMLENMNLKAVAFLKDMLSSLAYGIESPQPQPTNLFLQLKKIDYASFFRYDFHAFTQNSSLSNDHFNTSVELGDRKCDYAVEIMKMKDVSGRFNGIALLFTLIREIVIT